MNTLDRRVLVVADTLPLANTLLSWLKEAGYDAAVVTTYGAAKEHLKTAPHVLLTELKLREYNGLHLALRARKDGIPSAVFGAPDPGFAGDAHRLGATYVSAESLRRDDVLLLVESLLSSASARRGEIVAPAWEIDPADDFDADDAGAMDWDFDASRRMRTGGPRTPVVLH